MKPPRTIFTLYEAILLALAVAAIAAAIALSGCAPDPRPRLAPDVERAIMLWDQGWDWEDEVPEGE